MTTLSTPILSSEDQDKLILDFIEESKTLMRLLEWQASDAVINQVDGLIKEINQAISPHHCFFSEENNLQLASYARSLKAAKKIYAGSLSENALPQEAMYA